MKVTSEVTGKIRVLLSPEDVKQMGLDMQTLDCSLPETRRLLRTLFKLAALKAGVQAQGERLIIEAYPHLGGGGVLYFTPLPASGKKRLHKLKNDTFIFDFESFENLLKAAKILSLADSRFKSRLYLFGENYRLSIICDRALPELYAAKEFCDSFFTGEKAAAITAERGEQLLQSNVIERLCEYFKP